MSLSISTPIPALSPLREGAFTRWMVLAFLARLPGTMTSFALVLAGREATGSFSAGAWMASSAALGSALAAPVQGRRMDRGLVVGIRRASTWLAVMACVVCLACSLALPLPVLLMLSLLLGALPSGLQGGVRALLPHVVRERQLGAAFSLDAILVEIQWVVGPLLVGAASCLHAPLAALLMLGAVALVARFIPVDVAERESPPQFLFSSSPQCAISPPSPLRVLLTQPATARVYLAVSIFGASWGALEASVPARLESLGQSSALWGSLAAFLSLASVLGGWVDAMYLRPSAHPPATRVRALLAAFGALVLAACFANGIVTLTVALSFSGLFLASLTASLTLSLHRAVTEDRRALAFSLYSASFSVGLALGSASAGLLLRAQGPRLALLFAAIVPLSFALLARLRASASRDRLLRP